MSSVHTVLHDPQGLVEGTEELPLYREPYECLVTAVLAWTNPLGLLQRRDYEQIALQLTGHARAVAADVQRQVDRLPTASGRRAFAEVVLADAERLLSTPLEGTVRCVQNRARLVRALYARLDRLTAAVPAEHAYAPPPDRLPVPPPVGPGDTAPGGRTAPAAAGGFSMHRRYYADAWYILQ